MIDPRARQILVLENRRFFRNFPMAWMKVIIGFPGCRLPAKLVVLNTDSGAVVATLSIAGDPDDLFYDAKNQRVYAICGAGAIEVIDQLDRDSYQMTATIKTASGARTGLFVPELSSLFVAVPQRGAQTAEIRRYTVSSLRFGLDTRARSRR